MEISQMSPPSRYPPTLDEILSEQSTLVQSSDSTHWLPATKWFCELLSGNDPPRETILNSMVVASLVLFVTKKDDPKLQVEAAKALQYLSSGPSEAFDKASDPVHFALVSLLESKDELVLLHACCSFAVLSSCENGRFGKLIIDHGLHTQFMQLIGHPTLVFDSLLTLGNIMEGNEDLIDFCVSRGKILEKLRYCLADGRVKVRTQACWIVSYITAGKGGQWIQNVCDAGLIELLVKTVREGELVSMEAALWAILNATFGATVEQIGIIVSKGCLEVLCKLFCCRDAGMFKGCLDGLKNILKAGEKNGANNPYAEKISAIRGWAVLERIGEVYEKDLYEMALNLLVEYGSMPSDKRVLILTSREDGMEDYV